MFTAVPVHPENFQLQSVLHHAKVPYVAIESAEPSGGHPYAAANRYACGSKIARVLKSHLKKKRRETVLVMYPRDNELTAYERLFCRFEDALAVKFSGFRPVLRGSDAVRGRSTYESGLEDSDLFVASDSIVYYSTPVEVIEMFAGHPNIDEGIDLVLSGRVLLPGEHVWIEKYTAPAVELPDRVISMEIPGGVVPLKVDGETVMKKTGPVLPDGTRAVTPVTTNMVPKTLPGVSLPAVSEFEGYGWCVNGHLDWFASMHSSGDSVYSHRLVGGWWDTSEMLYAYNGSIFVLSIHVETPVGPYGILRVHIKRAGDTLDDNGVISHTTHPCPNSAFVVDGVIPSFASYFDQLVRTGNVEDAASLKQMEVKSFTHLQRYFGTQWQSLSMVEELSEKITAANLASLVLAKNRLTPPKSIPTPLGGRFLMEEKANRQARYAESVGEFVGGLGAEVGTKQPRLELIFNLLKRFWEGLKNLWNKIRGNLSLASFSLKLLAKAAGKVSGLQGTITTITNFLNDHESVGLGFDIVLTIYEVLVAPVWEELVKHMTPWWFSALFGAVEGLVVGLLDSGLFRRNEAPVSHQVKNVLKKVVGHCVVHLALSLIPLKAAIGLHAFYNALQAFETWSKRWPALAKRYAWVKDEYDRILKTRPALVKGMFHTRNVFKEREEIDDVELEEIEQQEGSRKIVIQSSAIDVLRETSGTYADASNVAKLRLQADVPPEQRRAWEDITEDVIIVGETYGAPKLVAPLSWEACHLYVDNRPYPTALKNVYHERLINCENVAKLIKKKRINIKPETLVAKPGLGAEEGDLATKSRHIHPAEEVDAQFMRLAVPLKEALTGTLWICLDEFGNLQVSLSEPICANPDERCSFTYSPAASADQKGEWMDFATSTPGWHVNQYGDDHISVVNQKTGETYSFAVDFKGCDVSCRKFFQAMFSTLVKAVFIQDDEVDELLALMLTRLTGEFTVETRNINIGSPVLIDKELSTNTGEFLTAMKTLSAGLFSCLKGFKIWLLSRRAHNLTVGRGLVHGTPAGSLYVAMTALSFVPEFETDLAGNVEMPMDCVTYLGGRFVESCSRWVWYNCKYIKAYCIFPPVERIYGPEDGVEKHMLVLTQDPDLMITPLGRALCRFFEKRSKHLKVDRSALVQRFDSYLATSGSGRYLLEKGRPVNEREIDFISFELHVQNVCKVLGHEPSCSMAELISSIQAQSLTVKEGPISIIGGDLLYVLRYGKLPSFFDHEEASLSFGSNFLKLAKKIYLYFNMKSQKQLEKPPAPTTVTASPIKSTPQKAGLTETKHGKGKGKTKNIPDSRGPAVTAPKPAKVGGVPVLASEHAVSKKAVKVGLGDPNKVGAGIEKINHIKNLRNVQDEKVPGDAKETKAFKNLMKVMTPESCMSPDAQRYVALLDKPLTAPWGDDGEIQVKPLTYPTVVPPSSTAVCRCYGQTNVGIPTATTGGKAWVVFTPGPANIQGEDGDDGVKLAAANISDSQAGTDTLCYTLGMPNDGRATVGSSVSGGLGCGGYYYVQAGGAALADPPSVELVHGGRVMTADAFFGPERLLLFGNPTPFGDMIPDDSGAYKARPIAAGILITPVDAELSVGGAYNACVIPMATNPSFVYTPVTGTGGVGLSTNVSDFYSLPDHEIKRADGACEVHWLPGRLDYDFYQTGSHTSNGGGVFGSSGVPSGAANNARVFIEIIPPQDGNIHTYTLSYVVFYEVAGRAILEEGTVPRPQPSLGAKVATAVQNSLNVEMSSRAGQVTKSSTFEVLKDHPKIGPMIEKSDSLDGAKSTMSEILNFGKELLPFAALLL
jgi:hypothetical protein